MTNTKCCNRCSEEKPLSEFHSNKQEKDGKSRRCISCQRAYHREYYLANQNTFKAKRTANREKIAAQNKAYYIANKDKVREYNRKYHKRRKDIVSEINKRHYQTVAGRARSLWQGAKQRLPKEFTLSLEHVIRLLEIGVCPVTGVAFDLRINTNGKRGRSFNPFSPSLDKIEPNLPYTDQNTRVVIWQYNLMKGELSDADVIDICQRIIARAA